MSKLSPLKHHQFVTDNFTCVIDKKTVVVEGNKGKKKFDSLLLLLQLECTP